MCDTLTVTGWLGNKASRHGYHLHYNVFESIAMLFKKHCNAFAKHCNALKSIAMDMQRIAM